MTSDVKKVGMHLFITLLMLLYPASALAAEDWAALSANPAADTTVKSGDMIAYTVVLKTDADGEQMLRIQMPVGVMLSENAFVYRPQSGEDEYSAIWGNDGCVLTLPRLSRGDMLMFVGRITDTAAGELVCSVTWNETPMTISHKSEAPVPTAQPEATPEATPAAIRKPARENSIFVGSNLDASAAKDHAELTVDGQSLERRQTVALLICTLLFSASSAGLWVSIRRYRQIKRNGAEEALQTKEEQL